MYLLIFFLGDSRKKCLEKSNILKELGKYISPRFLFFFSIFKLTTKINNKNKN